MPESPCFESDHEDQQLLLVNHTEKNGKQLQNSEQNSPHHGVDTSGGNSAQLHDRERRFSVFRDHKQLKVDIDVANQNSRHRQQHVIKIDTYPLQIAKAAPRRNETNFATSLNQNQLNQNGRQPKQIMSSTQNIKFQISQQQPYLQNYKSQNINFSTAHKDSDKGKLKIDVSVFVHEQKGKIKARYRILETIGKGSYGEVKKIQSKTNYELRAMKIIRKEDVSKEYMQSLLNEIDILKQLDHPNIVRIYEFYQDKLHFYLITEYIEGGELFDKITKVKCFTEADAAKVMKQLLSAVVYCHNKKIVHRDLKPENLLIDLKTQDSLKVIDFGTSQIFDPNTKMHQKYGTRRYDEKCDVWSCGVIMYILLCGYPPFKGKNHKEIFDKIKTGKFSFAAAEWKNVSREAKVMIKKMLTFTPEERVSAHQALEDEWIVQNAMRQTQKSLDQFHQPIMNDMMENLKKINVINTFHQILFSQIEQKLQQAVLTYFANYMNYDQEKRRLLEIFQAFDTNGDGQLDYKELLEGYTTYFNGDYERAEIEVTEILEKLDFNHNGNIDYSEFMIAHLNVAQMVHEDKLKEVFNLFDIDHSGTITVDEIKKILGNSKGKSNPNDDIDDNEWDRVLEEVDKDGNGEISFEEFKEMIYNMCNMEMEKKPTLALEEELKDGNGGGENNKQFKQQVSLLQSMGTEKTQRRKKKKIIITNKIKTKKSLKNPNTDLEKQQTNQQQQLDASQQQNI
ncbi:protein kinase domain containing protein [Stylonychia lemnae]|uniref:non-specific serine/threonine protein kinase n=1 Tax=Stylonychia lemnae TaxID=5949 RepID=A0A078BCE5_STYLE|nr:protein kinase domain containing protein [Stylonychia lemnae]|eukprot:CDW91278.1 protein kinase domain containing protein [Stylonychia lemnae]